MTNKPDITKRIKEKKKNQITPFQLATRDVSSKRTSFTTLWVKKEPA
jgi:hypothetical protein